VARARSLALILGISAGGCSLVVVRPSKAKPDCDSISPAIADVVLTIGSSIAAYYGLRDSTQNSNGYSGLGLVPAMMFGGSAIYGATVVAVCHGSSTDRAWVASTTCQKQGDLQSWIRRSHAAAGSGDCDQSRWFTDCVIREAPDFRNVVLANDEAAKCFAAK